MGEKQLKGHRILLAATNGKFRGMLAGYMKESYEKDIKIEGYSFQGFEVEKLLILFLNKRILCIICTL